MPLTRTPTSARRRAALCLLALVWVCAPAGAQAPVATAPVVNIPRVDRPPELDAFLSMAPSPEWEGKLAQVEGFVQREPVDDVPSTERTVVYLGYDQQNLYAIFVAFDGEPHKIRARLSRREDVFQDDTVQIMVDTFHDRRRSYSFISNPLGIQWDAIWTEGQDFDDSFDTVWHSDGRVTERGFVVRFAIPFKSLRFDPSREQTWGLMLNRGIPRKNEDTFWPRYTQRVQGRLNQAATLTGLENISPGRNIQIIPYGVIRSFRAIDDRDPFVTRFTNKDFEADGGVDAKFVIKDSFVLDITGNPDFSQVESDEPQVVVNQRFEVFFQEKRPFFLENANYFSTPIDLLFTRRIADPRFGARLTGKQGPWAVGALFADDQSPGKIVPEGHPLEGQSAYFGVLRINRDILNQSTIGITLTDREFDGSADPSLPSFLRTNYNRVGSVDTRIRLGANWQVEGQAVTSSTGFADGTKVAGPAYNFELRRAGYNFEYEFEYTDFSPGYRTQAGFVSRTDIRQASNFAVYVWRPKNNHPWLISIAPNFFHRIIYDHDGTMLDWAGVGELSFNFRKQSYLTFNYGPLKEVLRPVDFGTLTANKEFAKHQMGIYFGSTPIKQLRFNAQYFKTRRVNFVPGVGFEPHLADGNTGNVGITVQPIDQLRIENLYLFSRLKHIQTGANIFNNHIFRSKWNYQFTRELSVRFIGQYDTLISNPDPAVTTLPTVKNFNVDFLVTYLLNPGTALYVGYNSNLQNLDPTATFRTTDEFINDAKGLFVKFSYLFRF